MSDVPASGVALLMAALLVAGGPAPLAAPPSSPTFPALADRDGNRISDDLQAELEAAVTVDNRLSTMHVGDLDGSSSSQGRTWTASVLIVVHDSAEGPAGGAEVIGTWSTGEAASCTTTPSGACKVSLSGLHKRIGSVTLTVDRVSHSSLTYDATANHDPDGDSDGASVVVRKP